MESPLPIDYTLLRPDAGYEAVDKLCREAIFLGYHAVCIPPCYLTLATETLRNSPVRIATVVDYPHGFSPAEVKVYAAQMAILDGAQELDVVLNVSRLKSGNLQYVEAEIEALRVLTARKGVVLKVIIEAGLLSQQELQNACKICAAQGVDFVKNSSGVNGGSASPELIFQLRSLLPAHIQIKASGGIRTAEQARVLLQAGASRLGTSARILLSETSTV
ncbi:MAG: deoxyribose-phosphate aldolase [Bacteroidetes bacterium]|nr:deoxyribose-phosphate aldolase [Bacteroidota bacterium]